MRHPCGPGPCPGRYGGAPSPDAPRALAPLLRYASHLTRERFDARLSGSGVGPAQSHVLLWLCRHGGQASQRDVTAFLKVKPSTANGILERMEERGLIRRSVCEDDARQKRVFLTEEGREQWDRFHAAFQETEEAALRGLSEEETDTLFRLLGQVVEDLEEDRGL